ncbi:MAG: 5'-nucleotidase, partial [Bacteroidota bacterium]
DSEEEKKAADLESLVDKELNDEIGTLTVEWRRSFTSESNIGNWAADVLREFAGTDIALVNSGTLRKNMLPGAIRKRDMWQMFPFNNTFVTFTVGGETLKHMLEWQAAGKGEFMQVSGLRYLYDPEKPVGSKVVSAYVNNTPIDLKGRYTIATNNYVGGHLTEHLGVFTQGVTLRDL